MVGQHIRILKGGRWVHAVDCGDETVLHLAEEAPPPRVRRAYRPEFVAGADVVEVVTHRERTFPPKEIVKRAYSRASDPALASMFGDSESFVEWCTTGRLAAARNFAVAVPGFAPVAVGPAAAAAAEPAPEVNARAAVEPRRAAKPMPKAKAAPKAKPAPAVKAKAAARAKPAPAQKKKGAKVAARRAVAKKPAAKKAKAPVKAAARGGAKAARGGKAARPAKAGGKAKRARRGRR